MTIITDQEMPVVSGDETGPVFDAPWQALAFAIAVRLSKDGHFVWSEWVSAFAQEIANCPARTGETEHDAYYRNWLGALERIVVGKGLLRTGEAAGRVSEWRAAYANTPHGQAVELAHAACPPPHRHGNIAQVTPVAVSPASP